MAEILPNCTYTPDDIGEYKNDYWLGAESGTSQGRHELVVREKGRTFRQELEGLINRHSKENGSNTPDFILASYLIDCLTAFDRATQRREKWNEGEE